MPSRLGDRVRLKQTNKRKRKRKQAASEREAVDIANLSLKCDLCTHLLTHSFIHCLFIKYLFGTNTSVGLGAKVNVFQIGILKELETQEIRVCFRNHGYLIDFSPGLPFLCQCQNPVSALELPRGEMAAPPLSASPLAESCR